jgi:hypothetical protein
VDREGRLPGFRRGYDFRSIEAQTAQVWSILLTLLFIGEELSPTDAALREAYRPTRKSALVFGEGISDSW